MRSLAATSALAAVLAISAACAQDYREFRADTGAVSEQTGIRVPKGFEATVFADELGRVRHMAVREDGVVYAALRQAHEGNGIVALEDADGDGAADRIAYFGEGLTGTGIALRNGYLYYGDDSRIVRMKFDGGELIPSGAPEVVVGGFPSQRQHASKPITFDDSGHMFVTVGAPSNACQERSRTPGSPGLKPCPQLEQQAGIWRYDADAAGQQHPDDGTRYATGIRNAIPIDWHSSAGTLIFASHGRDQLSALFPEHYSNEENAELPAEEIHRTDGGSDHGWPYTYWDHRRGARMVAPEYGGDGETVTDGDYQKPIAAVPGHWAPNDLLIYTGSQFPAALANGAFIAFHGSWNRAPLPQQGYNVVFLPMDADGAVTGDWFVFADKFKGKDVLESPGEATHRPTGLAQTMDGSLLVSDDAGGRIWKIVYAGD